VVEFASARGVLVLPEIELPGHSSAAISAYPHLGVRGTPIPVPTRWGVFEDVYGVHDEVFVFLAEVLSQVAERFPSPYLHIGGDECPKTQWLGDARCRELMSAQGLESGEALQAWFLRRVAGVVEGLGRRVVGWSEISEGGLIPDATLMSWLDPELAVNAANAGHDVVMTPWTHTYFDRLPHELPLAEVYAFEPVPPGVDDATRVIGLQGQAWGERMPSPSVVERRVYPRACALAEVAWTAPHLRDFGDFQRRLDGHLPRLATAG
jgi:hexosaminidase